MNGWLIGLGAIGLGGYALSRVYARHSHAQEERALARQRRRRGVAPGVEGHEHAPLRRPAAGLHAARPLRLGVHHQRVAAAQRPVVRGALEPAGAPGGVLLPVAGSGGTGCGSVQVRPWSGEVIQCTGPK